jgi:hypothetical protein
LAKHQRTETSNQRCNLNRDIYTVEEFTVFGRHAENQSAVAPKPEVGNASKEWFPSAYLAP